MKRKFFERIIGTALVIVLVIVSVVLMTLGYNSKVDETSKQSAKVDTQIEGTINSSELDRDTPKDVQDGASNTVEFVENAKIALDEASAVSKRIRSDKDVATKLLTLAKANDKTGIIALLKRDAPQSQIEVVEIKDWTATFSFTVKGIKVTICGSNENGCNGGKASIVAK